ncbi:Gag-Pol polyprotein [Dictyocoela muelleri]|nr:Gag-Pol polyprotein [Dictyocoela muelleri]
MFFKRKFPNIESNVPFEKVSSDIYGPFDISEFKHEKSKSKAYYVTFTDIYSRLTRIYLLQNISGETIIKKLKSWICEFGPPKILISDNGKQYISKIIKKFLNSNNIKQLLIPPYSPISNGISERINKSITEGLRFNRYDKLDKIKKWVEFKINYNFNRNLGTSPNSLIDGYDFFDPHFVKKTFKKRIIRRKNSSEIKKLNTGDYVYLKNFMSKKLDKQYNRPHQIQSIGKKGNWIKLDGYENWFHIRSLKF